MFLWLFHVAAPPPLRALLLCNAAVSGALLVSYVLDGSGIDPAAPLAHGWDSREMLADLRSLSRALGAVYIAACLAWLAHQSTLVVLAAWLCTVGVASVPLNVCGLPLRLRVLAYPPRIRAALTVLRSLQRTLSPLNWSQGTSLMDTVVGDILTSYARLLVEIDTTLLCFLLRSGRHTAQAGFPPTPFALFLAW